MNERMSFPTDYDEFAPTYAWSRWPLPWIVTPLAQVAATLPLGADVLEIGCGTGNYVRALADLRGELHYYGFDRSEPMLAEARSRQSSVIFVRGDAATRLGFADQTFALAFAVD